MNRKYYPTFAELIDRLSIVQLKAIFIPENKEAYEEEIGLICHDIDEILKEQHEVGVELFVSAKMIRAMLIVMLTNRFIWENESKARLGGSEQDKLLKLTHSVNGVRNTAKNVISQELGERKDLKIDSLAADMPKEFGNWNIKWEYDDKNKEV